ncbi:type II toxin-antitoxin system VapC family toxin [Ruania alba]|nr:type II toxin-antitoxin system VapC family toxin [Ruania alba]
MVRPATDTSNRASLERILAAQAMLESLTLVTGDAEFHALPGLTTAW